jgi:hypothetical protein
MEFSLACTLSEPELRERRRLVLEPIRAAAVRLTPLPAGLACSFNASSEMLIKLAQLVDLERQCCRFLSFQIVVEAGEQALRLEVTGPPEAQSIIADFFGLPILEEK